MCHRREDYISSSKKKSSLNLFIPVVLFVKRSTRLKSLSDFKFVTTFRNIPLMEIDNESADQSKRDCSARIFASDYILTNNVSRDTAILIHEF